MKNVDFFAYAHINFIYRDKESSKSRKEPLITRKLQLKGINKEAGLVELNPETFSLAKAQRASFVAGSA
jgi:hypothetical protein